jgi:hypothetical protein
MTFVFQFFENRLLHVSAEAGFAELTKQKK